MALVVTVRVFDPSVVFVITIGAEAVVGTPENVPVWVAVAGALAVKTWPPTVTVPPVAGLLETVPVWLAEMAPMFMLQSRCRGLFSMGGGGIWRRFLC